MRAALVNAESFLEQRRRQGMDKFDEMWEGEWHFGITEALIVHEDRRFQLYRLDEAGAYQTVQDGRSTVLGVTFTIVDGPKLRIDWSDGSAEV